MGTAYLPPGWPSSVRPPGASGWEATAAAYLFDVCPPDFRGYEVLRRHLVVLARFATHFVAGQCAAAQEGLADVRIGLAGVVPPEVLQPALDAWLEQTAQLARTRRAVGLLEDAIRGRVFTPNSDPVGA